MSNADKRAVHTDALDSLGTIIGENEKRDAIHLAVEPAVAGEYLFPGDNVGFLDDGTIGLCENPVGVVDPFLKDQVEPGQRFWLVVYPRQITSLRHVWTHPAFDEPKEVEAIKTPVTTSEFMIPLPNPRPWNTKVKTSVFKAGDKARGIKGLGEVKSVDGDKVTVEWEDGSSDMWFDHMLSRFKPESETASDEDDEDDDEEDWACSC